MNKARQFFSDSDRELISNAIARAEKKTSGEIVPVVATVSGRYDRAEDLFGVFIALIALTVSWLFFQGISPAEGDWQAGRILGLGLIPILLIVLAGFFLGAVLATLFPALRLPLIAKREMDEEVERRAAEAFHRFRLRDTAGATGILIYISLYEHRVRVLGDTAISEKVGPSDWAEISRVVVEGIRAGRPTDGLCLGIEKSGELLSEHFPAESGDRDELVNELQFFD